MEPGNAIRAGSRGALGWTRGAETRPRILTGLADLGTGLAKNRAVPVELRIRVKARQRERIANVTDLHFLTIAEASAKIRAKALSPVELTQAFMARIKALDEQLNSHILVLEEAALADARQAEAEIMAGGWKGPLHGIPIGLKDIYNTKGVATTGPLRAVQGPCPGGGRVHRAVPAGGGRDLHRQTLDVGVRDRRHLVRPALAAGTQPVGPEPRSVRLVVRIRRVGGGGTVHGGDGLRHRRFDPRAGGVVRHRGPETDLRLAEPARDPAAVVLARSCRPDVLDQRGLRADDERADPLRCIGQCLCRRCRAGFRRCPECRPEGFAGRASCGISSRRT